MYDVVVVGLGASGLFALANIEHNVKALGIEKNKVAGKKLALTGGGRCNLTRTEDVKRIVAGYSHSRFVRPVLYGFNNKHLMEYFESRGLPLTVEDGKVFPKSEKASDVTRFFLKEIEQRGHELRFHEEVLDIVAHEDFVEVETTVAAYRCKNLIFACGGATYPGTGSDGRLMKRMFDISKLEPALCPLYVEDKTFDILRGVSTTVRVSYGKEIFEGSVLFSGSYLTGPVILDLSNYVQVGEDFVVDFVPEKTAEQLEEDLCILSEKYPKRRLKRLFLEVVNMPERVVDILFFTFHLDGVCLVDVKRKAFRRFLEQVKNYRFTVRAKVPLEQAMVSKGGVKLSDLDTKTLALKNDPRIMVVGEALEVVGNCGGYNLQFAFSSAYRAVRGIK